MLFISYWELNPDFDPSELADMAQMILNKKLWPVEGTKEIGWYISTGDYWGVTISEAETQEQLAKAANMWRIAKPGVFKVIKTTPAIEVTKTLPVMMKLAKQIKG
ncbi:MAG: DUF3303 domain-containing protein [Promethearchaeota archaeon]